MTGSVLSGTWKPPSWAEAAVGHPTATTAANTAPPVYRWRMTRFPLQRLLQPAAAGSPTRPGAAPRFEPGYRSPEYGTSRTGCESRGTITTAHLWSSAFGVENRKKRLTTDARSLS